MIKLRSTRAKTFSTWKMQATLNRYQIDALINKVQDRSIWYIHSDCYSLRFEVRKLTSQDKEYYITDVYTKEIYRYSRLTPAMEYMVNYLKGNYND